MKRILYIICVTVTICFASCQKSNLTDDSSDSDRLVAFSAESISSLTRVSGSNWEVGDEIGVTMVDFSSQSVIYDNVKYITSESGATVSFNPVGDAIYFPLDGSQVYFIAYSPYLEEWSYEQEDMKFDISAQDGTLKAQSKVDLLKAVIDTPQTGGAQVLNFAHYLTKIQITVSNYEPNSIFEDLDDLEAAITTSNVVFDVAKDESVTSDNPTTLKMVRTADGDKVIFTVIILPGEVNDVITFSDGTHTYTADLNLEWGEYACQYNFTAVVGDQGYSVVELASEGITQWEGQGEDVLSTDVEFVENVYQIYTAKGLELFSAFVNSGKTTIDGKLMNNINLEGSSSNQWTPIGNSSNPYAGTFEGGGFEVSELYINQSSSDGQGLFGYVSGATIKNLGVSGSVTGGEFVGGVAGSNDGGTIVNCYSSAAVSGTTNVGGVAGVNTNDGTIENCYVYAAMSGTNTIGGIVGANSGTVTSCYYNSTLYTGSGIGSGEDGDATGFSTADMQAVRLVYYLNNAAYTYNEKSATTQFSAWRLVSGDYPVFDTGNDPTYNDVDVVYDTENSLYQIYTADGLRAFSDLVNGSEQSVNELFADNYAADVATHFSFGTPYSSISGKLMKDIDLGGIDEDGNGISESQFSPIGSSSNPFYDGLFDGDNHTVYGLYIYNTLSSYQGLFGCIRGSTIKNISVNGTVTGYRYVGGVVGCAESTSLLENCNNSATVTGFSTNVGGVVGCVIHTNAYDDSLEPAIIHYCHNSGSVKGAGLYVGGVIGRAAATTVQYCSNAGAVYQTSGGAAGGVVGVAYYSTADIKPTVTYTLVDNCYNTANVESDGGTGIGGVVGSSDSPSVVSNCYNRGAVKGSNTYVGGVVGNGNKEKTCYNTGSVTGSSTGLSGGVTGASSSANLLVEYCYYDSEVVTGVTGAVKGANDGIIYCGLSTENMKGAANTVGTMLYYFTNSSYGNSSSWMTDTGINDGYPILTWQVTAK